MSTFEQKSPTIEDPFYEKIFVGEILEAKAAVKEKTSQVFKSISSMVDLLEEKLQEALKQKSDNPDEMLLKSSKDHVSDQIITQGQMQMAKISSLTDLTFDETNIAINFLPGKRRMPESPSLVVLKENPYRGIDSSMKNPGRLQFIKPKLEFLIVTHVWYEACTSLDDQHVQRKDALQPATRGKTAGPGY